MNHECEERDELEAIGSRCGIRIAFEFFADRAYNKDGSLVSRREPGALIQVPDTAADRVLKWAKEGKVLAAGGAEIALAAQTVCVHGDNPAAVALTRRVRESLLAAGFEIVPLGTFL